MRKKEEKKRGHRGPDTEKEGRKRGELSEGKRERERHIWGEGGAYR